MVKSIIISPEEFGLNLEDSLTLKFSKTTYLGFEIDEEIVYRTYHIKNIND